MLGAQQAPGFCGAVVLELVASASRRAAAGRAVPASVAVGAVGAAAGRAFGRGLRSVRVAVVPAAGVGGGLRRCSRSTRRRSAWPSAVAVASGASAAPLPGTSAAAGSPGTSWTATGAAATGERRGRAWKCGTASRDGRGACALLSAGQRGHPAAARGAIVEVLLGGLVAPVAEAQRLDGPWQAGLRRLQREHLPHDLERSRPCPGPCRPCRARRAAAARDRKTGRAGDTAGARTFAKTLAAAPARGSPLTLCRLRVLIFHGYLLQGTGSNVYNAELGAALVRARPRGAPGLPGPRSVRAGLGRRGGRLGRRARWSSTSAARPRARRSTGPTSAACCRSTSPTATRASRRGRSRS